MSFSGIYTNVYKQSYSIVFNRCQYQELCYCISFTHGSKLFSILSQKHFLQLVWCACSALLKPVIFCCPIPTKPTRLMLLYPTLSEKVWLKQYYMLLSNNLCRYVMNNSGHLEFIVNRSCTNHITLGNSTWWLLFIFNTVFSCIRKYRSFIN